MRAAKHHRSYSDGLRIFGISAVEAWAIAMVWSITSFFLPGWLSLIGLAGGYALCVAGDQVQPKFVESYLIYAFHAKIVFKR